MIITTIIILISYYAAGTRLGTSLFHSRVHLSMYAFNKYLFIDTNIGAILESETNAAFAHMELLVWLWVQLIFTYICCNHKSIL